MGFLSLPVVALTAIFAGMVIALQSYTGFARFSAQSATASIVVLSVTRELGPVLAGLMMSGRAGAAKSIRRLPARSDPSTGVPIDFGSGSGVSLARGR